MSAKKGFTLIELLVVLAIVAILSVVVILTLNPAELLKQSRDSNRISDVGTLKSAISLYLADFATPNLVDNGTGNTTYSKCWMSSGPATGGATSTNFCGVFTSYFTATTSVANANTNRLVNGTGWVPVKFTDISSGAPIGNLPIDPTNTANLYYAYAATSTQNGFKITTVLESSKYNSNMLSDGGTSNNFFEVGTNLTL